MNYVVPDAIVHVRNFGGVKEVPVFIVEGRVKSLISITKHCNSFHVTQKPVFTPDFDFLLQVGKEKLQQVTNLSQQQKIMLAQDMSKIIGAEP